MYRVGPAPHIRTKEDVSQIMWWVVIAMMPMLISSVIMFGFRALVVTVLAVLGAVASEKIAAKIFGLEDRTSDGSAVITGMLVAFNVSVSTPMWMTVVGSVFAIVFAKMVFGGLGFNPVNPALAGRAFLMASWPVELTSMWKTPNVDGSTMSGIKHGVDAITTATPLHYYKMFNPTVDMLKESLAPLFFGNVGGVMGETSALAILIGAGILLYKRLITLRIPLTYIGTVFVLAWAFGKTGARFTADFWVEPTFHILAGGLFLGAFFMATDMVTSPITKRGQTVFAILLGTCTFLIRKYGGYPEGVSYSILLMNLLVPFLNRFLKPKVFGKRGK